MSFRNTNGFEDKVKNAVDKWSKRVKSPTKYLK